MFLFYVLIAIILCQNSTTGLKLDADLCLFDECVCGVDFNYFIVTCYSNLNENQATSHLRIGSNVSKENNVTEIDEFTLEEFIIDKDTNRNHSLSGLVIHDFTISNSIFSYFDAEFFQKVKDITNLIIKNSTFQKLNPNAFTPLNSTIFTLQINNTDLFLNDAFTYQMLNQLFKLEKLVLTFNNIKEIKRDYFKNMVHLTELNLDDNRIEFIEENSFADMSSLNMLYLNFNDLKNITKKTFSNLINLNYLYLNRNKLVHIEENSFSELLNLKVLSLSGNKLLKLDANTLNGLTNLDTLYLSYNKLTRLDDYLFKNLTNLNTLYLKRNNLDVISSNAFYGLNNLTDLDLSYNKLNRIEMDSFDKLKKLKSLNIKTKMKKYKTLQMTCN